MKNRGLEVCLVKPESIAAELGLEPGDRVLSINGETLHDLIDYRFWETEEKLSIDVKKAGGELWILDVEKDFDQCLGLEFSGGGFGRTRRCSNKCVFCFVDQMPVGLRKTLYVRDDDYRLSFWSGNFITLTNLKDNELRRIARQRLSPIYISVHTTNPALRREMLGSDKAALIMDQLGYLAEAGIEMHTQVVLCPGLNDGAELERTTSDLAGLWPSVSSLAVVPVGLTRYRQELFQLRGVASGEASDLVRWVGARQKQYTHDFGDPFIFASDEFYLLAGETVPPAVRYGSFPQLENGVGLTRLFLDEWAKVQKTLPPEIAAKKAAILTGSLAAQILSPVAERLNKISGLNVSLHTIENYFFGRQVTVAGLVTGRDILKQVAPGEAGDLLVIPSVMLKKEAPVFLDDISLAELASRLQVNTAAVAGPRQLVDVLTGSPERADVFIKNS
ncbi:hypothetical protein Pmgp_01374 [Pelotomaculum propionicicum]|uniref:PDZ domain-containing protein n=1 Tax=Pelotomaculum propionicicum TaxID=258475 RepID=A0A4Y7RSR7_9FIRM|nr:hypothetical protein Pmgp_01374 [Pelotomaculum propionicicum]